MIPTEIQNQGAIAILFFFFMKELFSYLRAKKNNNGKTATDYERDMAEVKLQLENHYNGLRRDVAKIQTDMAIMKNDSNDTKIALKNMESNINDIKIAVRK